MLIRPAILGPVASLALLVSVGFGQNAKYNQPFTSVGNLQQVGVIGRSDPMVSFGRVGGLTTGRFDTGGGLPQNRTYQSSQPSGNRPMGSSRPRGSLDPQNGFPGYSGGATRIPSSFEFRQRSTNPRTTFENNRLQSFVTRHQLARSAIAADSVRDTGVLADWRVVLDRRQRAMTPVERYHADANLLSPKSALAQMLSTQETVTFSQPAPVGAASTDHVPVSETMIEALERKAEAAQVLDNAIAQRLARQYQDYEQSGLAFFKSRNWIRARDCFDTCRSLDRKNPWPLAIDTLVALETGDASRAANSLLGAVTRLQSLSDIKLEIGELYATRLEFEKCVDKASLLASNDPPGKPQFGHLLLSYCAWLKGDLATAASAAQLAAKSMPEEIQKNVTRYADLLREQATGSGNPPA